MNIGLEKYRLIFESKIDKNGENGCWIWLEHKNSKVKGYGRFCYNGIRPLAHRFSHELYNGPIPEGLLVCHKCDNSSCVNPEHLFLGTIQENNLDRDKKNRQVSLKGELCATSKLTEKEVLEIRAKYKPCKNPKDKSCYSQRRLAKEYGVKQITIWNIVNNKSWEYLC